MPRGALGQRVENRREVILPVFCGTERPLPLRNRTLPAWHIRGLRHPPAAVSGMFNWLTTTGLNLLLYQDGSEIKTYQQLTTAINSILNVPGNTQAPSFSPLDIWTYMCGYDAVTAPGLLQVNIFDGTNIDKASVSRRALPRGLAVDGWTGHLHAGNAPAHFVYQQEPAPGTPGFR